MSRLASLLFGRTLSNREAEQKKLAVWEAIPAMGLDALGSSAYGPEAALMVLAPLGVASPTYVGFLTLAIVLLLGMVFLSYRQTLDAYPENAGAYPVVKSNLGEGVSLLAASALVIDYVLNVAVAIAAGVAALISLAPGLQPHTLSLCLAMLGLIALVNLRGTAEAGRLFALPVYLFIASFLVILAIGGFKAAAAGGHSVPLTPPHPLGPAIAAADLWLLLHAFASGCTALTGVEAVSDSMRAFRAPPQPRARATLGAIVGVLTVLLLGIAGLARAYHVGAMEETRPGYRSVLAQLAGAVAGEGPLYHLAVTTALAILVLSANTSFTAFPRLCNMLAQDGFLPRAFALVGRRLVHTAGIIYLTLVAAALLVLFGGITDRLIPLFAIGAFLTFTLSQTAMTVHWWRILKSGKGITGTRRRLYLNAAGAAATAAALVVIIGAKFAAGAWISILAIPVIILILRSVRRYYDLLYRRMEVQGSPQFDLTPPLLLVAVESWSEPSRRALALAMRMSPDVTAVHLTATTGPQEELEAAAALLKAQWPMVQQAAIAAGHKAPGLCMIPAPRRRLDEPLLEFIGRLQPGARAVAVLIPELIPRHWWQRLLHTGRARRLRAELLQHGEDRVTVVDVPWHLEPVAQKHTDIGTRRQ